MSKFITYRICNQKGELLYCGTTTNMKRRQQQHQKWINYLKQMPKKYLLLAAYNEQLQWETMEYTTKMESQEKEKEIIKKEQPLGNIHHRD